MTSELKPCPFCGGEAIIRERHRHTVYTRYARCTQCKATTQRNAIEDAAIAAWNRRAERSPVEPAGVTEWRDISSAPRDGRFVLLHVPQGLESGVVTVGAYWKAEGRADNGRFVKGNWDGWLGMDIDVRSSWCEPTHWMPLAEPPK